MHILLLFIIVPLIEIGLFIQVGGWFGLWPTLGIVVLTAIIGTYQLRMQGTAVLAGLQNNIELGKSPVDPILNGALILCAAVLLLTPGFFTDAVGFALLAPPVRRLLIKWGAARVLQSRSMAFTNSRTGPSKEHDIVDGEFVVLDDEDAKAAHGAPPKKPK